MSLNKIIFEETNKDDKDNIYYKFNDVEEKLFELKNMITDKEILARLDELILELNSIRMDTYNN